MAIKPVPDNQHQNFNRVANHPLQSWEWGEFRKRSGNEVIRLGIYKNNKLESSMQLLLHKIPFTDFKIGSLIKGPEPTLEILYYLKKLAKK